MQRFQGRRQSAPPQRGGNPYIRPIILAGIVLLVLAGAFFLQYRLFPDGRLLGIKMQGKHPVGPLMGGSAMRINEIMSANASALSDADGATPDWIEVTNAGPSPVDLKDYTLAKSADSQARFTFPEHVLQSGECVVVFADSRLRNAAGDEYHAPFRLSAAGDTLLLFNAVGTAIDTVSIPPLAQDVAYRRLDGNAWEQTREYTPGLPNTAENHRSLREVLVESPLRITELMASNAEHAPDELGQFHDYIEIYNASTEAISLKGYRLSDTREMAGKWHFPDVQIGPGEYRIVYASGLDRQDADGGLHTSFRLSSAGESVVLANADGQLLDAVDFPSLNANQVYSRQADGSWTVELPPTPGAANRIEASGGEE